MAYFYFVNGCIACMVYCYFVNGCIVYCYFVNGCMVYCYFVNGCMVYFYFMNGCMVYRYSLHFAKNAVNFVPRYFEILFSLIYVIMSVSIRNTKV